MTDPDASRPPAAASEGPPPPEPPPPILGTWPRLYGALVVALVLQCAFFAWLTEWAS
jgi:hypothetical protein